MRRARAARLWTAAAIVLTMAACGPTEAADQPPQTGAEARPSYSIRLDSESSDPTEFQVVEDDDGVRVTTGPAGIAYRDEDTVQSGDMRVEAVFAQYDAPPGYREAFGLFVGGQDLTGPDQEYTYLLVRTTGDVLVKRRLGGTTETMLDWVAHPSVTQVENEGDLAVNVLSIDVFQGETHFMVNGDVVYSAPASVVRPYGIAGIRVNHRLDVRVDDWTLLQRSEAS